jgi:hypothetical protein
MFKIYNECDIFYSCNVNHSNVTIMNTFPYIFVILKGKSSCNLQQSKEFDICLYYMHVHFLNNEA